MTMTLTEATRSAFAKFATFTGRARRSEYWWFSVTYVVAATALAVIATVLDAPVVYLAAVVVAIPMLAVSVRRFHDRGRSGWNLLVNLIPVVGTIIYLVGMAREGDPDANRYGPAV